MQRVLPFAKKLPWADMRARLRVVGAGMQWLNARLPARYGVWIASMLGVLLALFTLVGFGVGLLREKVAAIDERIAQLQGLRHELSQRIEQVCPLASAVG